MDCKIIKHGHVLEEGNGGWKVEINLVSWYGKDPKWEIRSWNEDHTKCGKGIALSEKALDELTKFLTDIKDKEESE